MPWKTFRLATIGELESHLNRLERSAWEVVAVTTVTLQGKWGDLNTEFLVVAKKENADVVSAECQQVRPCSTTGSASGSEPEGSRFDP
jgi:hypothetical protein